MAVGFYQDAELGPITFRLGFMPFGKMVFSHDQLHAAVVNKATIWSDPVTITADTSMLRILNTRREPSGGVTILKEDISSEDIPFEVKRLMLRDGARNIEFSVEEKALLSDEERKILKKYE